MAAASLPSVPHNPAERLAALIDALCKAVAAHGVRGLLTAPLVLMVWSRLRRMGARAERLAGRIARGTALAPPRPRKPRTTPSRPYVRLPQGVAWLVRAVPATASGASQLRVLLADPRMAALAQLPPMRRLLNPLCRLLGVPPPPPAPPTPARVIPAPVPPAPPPPRQAEAAPPLPHTGGAVDPPPHPPPPGRSPAPWSA